MSEPITGKGVDRVDARQKVTGQAPYAAEIAVANAAHAVIVGSPVARGRIADLDTAAAEQAPGVLAVLTHRNAPRLPGAAHNGPGTDRLLQLLQDDQVHYNDQPIALVVADTLERARHAASLVVARYEPAAAALDPVAERAQAYAPDKLNEKKSSDQRGDVDQGLRSAKARVDQTYTTPEEHHNPLEMHATTAVWQGEDRLQLYDSTQGIFEVRRKISDVFGIPRENVRVISHFVGGGFGCKGSVWSHVALAAMAARAARRGVRLMVSRPQMFSLVGHRPRTEQRVVLAADAGGKLVAVEHHVHSTTSRIDEFAEPCTLPTRMLYACPNLRVSQRLITLDIPTPTFMRAPGEASGTFALESAMDELAYALKLDPIELRARNHADRDPDENKPWSSKSLLACYRQGAERFGWAARKPQPRSMRQGHLLIGLGVATATYPARQRPASALARLRPDGSALVQAGSQDIGTGTYTIMTQIAADALGLPIERVRFELGDTAMPETPGSGGSTTASSVGSAVKKAGLALRSQLIELAVADARSPLHGLAPDAVDASDGALFARSEPARRETYAALLARSGKPELLARVDEKEKDDRKNFSHHSFGAQFVEVSVDEDLGEVRVRRALGVFGVGKVLNAKTARSQLVGGIVWGIGMALHERTVRDLRDGRVVTRDLADYHVPVHADVPAVDVLTVDEADEHVNPIGAKGIGEIGITGVAAAIANAVFHATGRRVRSLPITLDKLL